MVTHRQFGCKAVFAGEGIEDGGVFVQRFFSDACMKHKTENMEVGVKVLKCIPHQLIASQRKHLVVKYCVEPRKAGIVQPLAVVFQGGHTGSDPLKILE